MVELKGTRLTIRYCEQPAPNEDPASWRPPSWDEALLHIPGSKHAFIWAKMAARRQALANAGQLRSPDYWNTEGVLPDGKHFYAIKAGKVRAYGWFSSREKGVFYISHFALKKGQKLDRKDTNLVIQNWRRLEERVS